MARGEQECDRLRQQAAGHERERSRGAVIEPLCVIDNG